MAGLSTHYDLLVSAKATIDALDLPNVVVRVGMLPRRLEEVNPLPLYVVAPSPGTERDVSQTTATDDISFPVYVVGIYKSNQDFQDNLETYLYHREQISNKLRWDINNWVNPPSKATRSIPADSVTLDEGKLNEQYAYLPQLFEVEARLTRG